MSLMFYFVLSLLPCSFALVDITSTYYTKMNEGLTTLSGDDIWTSTACTSCGIFNLSYNSFTSTNIATFDFRKTTGGITYEDNIRTLILSHNQIVDPSLGTFTQGSPSSWSLERLDLSYNMITNLTSFPRMAYRGQLVYLNFEYNLIFALDHNVFQPYAVDEMTEINMENNRLKIVPTLSIDQYALTDTKIGMKNNEISALSPEADCAFGKCGQWYLRTTDWQNNKFTEESYKFEEHCDPEIFNFNYNKFTSLFPNDLYSLCITYHNMKELYIANNDIETINSAEISKPVGLVMLDLKNNKITEFDDPGLSYPRPSLLTIDVRG